MKTTSKHMEKTVNINKYGTVTDCE